MCYTSAYHKELKKGSDLDKSSLKQENKETCFYVINHYEF